MEKYGIPRESRKVVAVSGGFDPIHPGHIAYIEGAIDLAWDHVLVILTRDDQLISKKGKVVLPYFIRCAILEWGLRGRGKVVENIDKDITAKESLSYYKPNIFAKGGDTWNLNSLPEKEVCKELGIKMLFGVGGYNKEFSSREIHSRIRM